MVFSPVVQPMKRSIQKEKAHVNNKVGHGLNFLRFEIHIPKLRADHFIVPTESGELHLRVGICVFKILQKFVFQTPINPLEETIIEIILTKQDRENESQESISSCIIFIVGNIENKFIRIQTYFAKHFDVVTRFDEVLTLD
jgi:hypothetical protein